MNPSHMILHVIAPTEDPITAFIRAEYVWIVASLVPISVFHPSETPFIMLRAFVVATEIFVALVVLTKICFFRE